ncbi:hypothetical protein [Gracilibacillus alcaliphilus]|uniref:hypothetical protein n=1 Tax=Gracilibacillus alcaliphilus TaxID=1401441 RepID=UPI00195BCE3E|nr:hypothetical protein [Gracilibacillus alcaliphilus]MBM7677832.1 hypothetical protein [Gracilibacillus alcaliphilus]
MKKWIIAISILLTLSPYVSVYHHADTLPYYAELSDNSSSHYQTINDIEKTSDIGMAAEPVIWYSAISLMLILFAYRPVWDWNRHLFAVFYQSNYLITYRKSS